MKGNKILYAGIAILILGIGFAAGTYAYYQTTVTGTASGTVLAWNCTANGETATFTIPLGSLYPGSSATKTITIASSIDADYKITFSNMTNMGAGSTHPNLKIYKDSAHSSAIANSSEISGTVTGGSSTDVNLYVYWPYGTEGGANVIDTYNSGAPSVKATVLCTQK